MTTPPDRPASPAHGAPVAGAGRRNRLSPKKLLLSKWAAVHPVNREQHFLVARVIQPKPPATRIEHIELEAVHAGRVLPLHWRDLTDPQVWRQGWA